MNDAVKSRLLAKLIDDMADLDPSKAESEDKKPAEMEIMSIEAKPKKKMAMRDEDDGEHDGIEDDEPMSDLHDDEEAQEEADHSEMLDDEMLAHDDASEDTDEGYDEDEDPKSRFKKMVR